MASGGRSPAKESSDVLRTAAMTTIWVFADVILPLVVVGMGFAATRLR